MRKVLLTLCLLCCFLLPTTARAATGEVEIRNTEFTEEELVNRNGKLLIECRLAIVSAEKVTCFYLDNWQPIYIGKNNYTCYDVIEVIQIWNPATNYTDDCEIITRSVRVFNQFGLSKEKGVFA